MTAPPPLRPFDLGAVRVDDASVFARARDELLHLARVYPVDRLLAVFRRNAGLDTRGADAPGNWEGFGHPNEAAWSEHDYPGREHAQTANLLRGHYAGHFLSMLAFSAAGEHDPALRAKVDEFVAGLGEVQAALAATGRFSHPGFLAAYGEWQFSRLEDFAPYGEIWAPYYTCHKIMAGLLDAHELTANAQALAIATAMGHWVHHRLSRLDPERRQRMWSLYIAGEFGGMNETLARLSAAADEPLFLATAAYFDQENVLEAGAARTDILTDMHANQHLPQLIGYVDEYELTGDRRYLDAAIGIWDQIVPGRVYAHGGTGESELWGPPQHRGRGRRAPKRRDLRQLQPAETRPPDLRAHPRAALYGLLRADGSQPRPRLAPGGPQRHEPRGRLHVPGAPGGAARIRQRGDLLRRHRPGKPCEVPGHDLLPGPGRALREPAVRLRTRLGGGRAPGPAPVGLPAGGAPRAPVRSAGRRRTGRDRAHDPSARPVVGHTERRNCGSTDRRPGSMRCPASTRPSPACGGRGTSCAWTPRWTSVPKR